MNDLSLFKIAWCDYNTFEDEVLRKNKSILSTYFYTSIILM